MTRPTGTVTFLFTDIEGSTRLWQDDAGAMATALARHDAILRESISAHRGLVFSTGGDGVGAAFWTAAEAVAAATAAQELLASERWPESVVIRVRMGLHTGTAEERDGDYFGSTVNRAARLMACGRGGQVVVSDTTARLLVGADLVDLGEHRLKDIAQPERVWQVGRGSFGSLRSLRRAGNLPSAATSFVGRQHERDRVADEVRSGRVLTLTGLGGVGKTRLALAVAEVVEIRFPDGAWWVDLGPVGDRASVAAVFESVVASGRQPGGSPIDSVTDALRGRAALVIVDNCEHLIDGVSTAVEAIVASCPTVAVLATSREPLGVSAEWVWPVGPLDSGQDAIALFVERAAATDASFRGDADRAVLVEVCQRLDGIPLAIELAAARVRTMTPTELLGRLDDRFRLLRASVRGGTDRHRTLGATLDWSYGLLSSVEQAVFDRLAVFAGSFDFAAAAAVCTDDTIDADDMFDLLAALVDKSVLTAVRSERGTRYRMLETVRQYAQAHLAASGDHALRRHRHVEHYVCVAESMFDAWVADYTTGRQRLEDDWDNLRSACRRAVEAGDGETIGRLLLAVGVPARMQMRYEVIELAERAARLPDPAPGTLAMAAMFAGIGGRFDDQIRYATAGIDTAPHPDHPSAAWCWTQLNIGLTNLGRYDEAFAAAERAHVTITEAMGDWGDARWSGMLARFDPDPYGARAVGHAARAEAIVARTRNPLVRADAMTYLGEFYARSGQPDRAVRYCHEALALADLHDMPWSRNMTLDVLATIAPLGVLDDPKGAFRTAIEYSYEHRGWFNLWSAVRALARWWAEQGRLEDAAVVAGHFDAHRVASVGRSTRETIGRFPERERWCALGAQMDREALVRFTLERLDEG